MDYKVAIIGMGYVGLPLAIEVAKCHQVVGFDINSKRLEELKADFDRTREVTAEQLSNSSKLSFPPHHC